jgi:hypothetical protein
MNGPVKVIALVMSAALAIAGVGMLFVAVRMRLDANSSLEGTRRLQSARLHVARAQEQLGDSDIEDALARAKKANAAAERVGVLTEKVLALLRPTAVRARSITTEARRGTRNAVTARRRAEVTSRILGAIAGYQRAAGSYANITNRALHRILIALRKTNRSFPGGR